jgi:hypothetical protein
MRSSLHTAPYAVPAQALTRCMPRIDGVGLGVIEAKS